jgi:hypothetical protein
MEFEYGLAIQCALKQEADSLKTQLNKLGYSAYVGSGSTYVGYGRWDHDRQWLLTKWADVHDKYGFNQTPSNYFVVDIKYPQIFLALAAIKDNEGDGPFTPRIGDIVIATVGHTYYIGRYKSTMDDKRIELTDWMPYSLLGQSRYWNFGGFNEIVRRAIPEEVEVYLAAMKQEKESRKIIGYELIQEYPGSTSVGTIVPDCGPMKFPYDPAQYPQFWKPFYEKKKIIPIFGSELNNNTRFDVEIDQFTKTATIKLREGDYKFSREDLTMLLGKHTVHGVDYYSTKFQFGCNRQYAFTAKAIQRIIDALESCYNEDLINKAYRDLEF